MKCPSCGCMDNKVIDSRLSQGGEVTRRRRMCDGCGHRYTTYERIERAMPMIVKKDMRRESFEREKVIAGIRKACEKRPVSWEKVEQLVNEIERELAECGEKEVDSSRIGEQVMEQLRKVDQVAYVRFASVYRSFKDIREFMNELTSLLTHPTGDE